MNNSIYREKTINRISSPEQLNAYLKVTKPGVWIVLVAVVVLLVGMLVWGLFINIGSNAEGTAEVKNGSMTVSFEDSKVAENVTEGMVIEANGASYTITGVENGDDGTIRAFATADIKDGTYPAKVCYRSTGLMGILFGD
jgi:hypothetical protein